MRVYYTGNNPRDYMDLSYFASYENAKQHLLGRGYELYREIDVVGKGKAIFHWKGTVGLFGGITGPVHLTTYIGWIETEDMPDVTDATALMGLPASIQEALNSGDGTYRP